MQPAFKIQEMFPETFALSINKRVHSMSGFIRSASLERNVSKCVLISILHIIKMMFSADSVLRSFK